MMPSDRKQALRDAFNRYTTEAEMYDKHVSVVVNDLANGLREFINCGIYVKRLNLRARHDLITLEPILYEFQIMLTDDLNGIFFPIEFSYTVSGVKVSMDGDEPLMESLVTTEEFCQIIYSKLLKLLVLGAARAPKGGKRTY